MANYLIHSPADVLRWGLVALGLGTDPTLVPRGSWPAFCDQLSEDLDEQITVQDTQGNLDGRAQITGEPFDHHGVQVLIRCRHPAAGWTKADAVRKGLAEDATGLQVTIGASTYLIDVVTNISSVLRLGQEPAATGRRRYSINAFISLGQLS